MKTYTYIAYLAALLIAATAAAAPPQPGPRVLAGRKVEQYYLTRPDIVDVPPVVPGLAASSSPKAVVILMDFEDYRPWFHPTADYFQDKLFGTAPGSMRSYFREVSYDIFDLDGRVVGWYTSDALYDDIVNPTDTCGQKNDYGLDISESAIDPQKSDYPLNIWGIVAEAVDLADDDVDFAYYDNDGPDGIPSSGDDDGYVDFLFVIHPGPGAEQTRIGSCNDIWSLQSDLESYRHTSGTTADGVGIGPFVIVPEVGEIGVYAHECCHLLGLPDLYNSVDGDPIVGDYCLMDQGAWAGPGGAEGRVPAHLSAPMKYFLGWIEPTSVCMGCESDSIINAPVQPSETWRTRSSYRILNNPNGMDWNLDGTGEGEYFLVENRHNDVAAFDTFLPGSGLLIWKVDESQPHNNSEAERLAIVIQADGDGSPKGSVSDFWPGSLSKTEFSPYSDPPSNLGGGRFSGVSIDDIRWDTYYAIRMDIRLGLPKRGSAYAFPNPFTPEDDSNVRIVFVRQPGPAVPWSFSVDIFDVEGNLVRRLEGTGETLDNGTAIWDGKDDSGRNVREGLYMYVAESTGETASGVLALRR